MTNYVNSFNLFGIEARQKPTLTGKGAPTSATAGTVGELYMDAETGKLYKCVSENEGVYAWEKMYEENTVMYSEQELTDEQKKQARDNIDALGKTRVEQEALPFTYTTSYANATTFVYTKQDWGSGYWMFECGTIKGGTLFVNWDTAKVTQFELIIYLFDAEGNPYAYTQKSGPNPNPTPFAGEKVAINWSAPGTGGGFCKATAPFTVEIPDGCSVMVCMRTTNIVINPDSGATANTIAVTADKVFDVTVEKVTVDENLYDALVMMGLFDESPEEDIEPITKNYDTNVKSIAHRGLSTLAPENTISAFKLAKERGFRYVEGDVLFTSDGVPVMLHDTTIDRTSNGTGSISSMTLDQVRTYDFGSWKDEKYAGEVIPTFEEFIVFCKKAGLHPYIEPKLPFSLAQLEILVNIVKRCGMIDKVTWIGGVGNLTNINTLIPNARIGYVTMDITEDIVNTALGLKSDTNEVFIDTQINNDLTSAKIDLCINAGIPLEVWTVTLTAQIPFVGNYVSGMTTNEIHVGKILEESVL